jgi:hypothetical protein
VDDDWNEVKLEVRRGGGILLNQGGHGEGRSSNRGSAGAGGSPEGSGSSDAVARALLASLEGISINLANMVVWLEQLERKRSVREVLVETAATPRNEAGTEVRAW